MAETIVQRNKLPRAIAKEKDGIVMFWVEELQVAGLHVRGLERFLNCDHRSAVQFVKGAGELITLLAAEIVTESGIQVVNLITEKDLPKVLRYISRSKAKAETRDRADDLRDRLAAAGFKLAVMLELAPQQLKEQVDRHVEELILRKEILALEIESAKVNAALLDKRHYIVTALPEPVQQKILGYTELKTVEYVDRTIAPDGSINDGVGITYIQKRYGFKSTKEAWTWLERIGMGKYSDKWQHQLKAVESAVLPREYLEELDTMYGESPRQRWLGE